MVNWRHLWQHSIGVGILTREGLPMAGVSIDDDTDYIIGLVHNVGKIVIAFAFPEEFDRLMPYPDEVTYDIIAAASEILALPSATVHESFGKYWIDFAINSGYEPMFSMSGNNLFMFLEDLDELHTRLSLSFPDYRPPTLLLHGLPDPIASLALYQ